jgi:hypothetical protein
MADPVPADVSTPPHPTPGSLPCPKVAPAMNTFMWESPFTKQHLEVLQKLGAQVGGPQGPGAGPGGAGQRFCCRRVWLLRRQQGRRRQWRRGNGDCAECN